MFNNVTRAGIPKFPKADSGFVLFGLLVVSHFHKEVETTKKDFGLHNT